MIFRFLNNRVNAGFLTKRILVFDWLMCADVRGDNSSSFHLREEGLINVFNVGAGDKGLKPFKNDSFCRCGCMMRSTVPRY